MTYHLKKAHLELAKIHLGEAPNILWSNETNKQLFGYQEKCHGWCKPNTAHHPRNIMFFSGRDLKLVRIERTMDGAKYREVFVENLFQSSRPPYTLNMHRAPKIKKGPTSPSCQSHWVYWKKVTHIIWWHHWWFCLKKVQRKRKYGKRGCI